LENRPNPNTSWFSLKYTGILFIFDKNEYVCLFVDELNKIVSKVLDVRIDFLYTIYNTVSFDKKERK
jgi:hypothetical protein